MDLVNLLLDFASSKRIPASEEAIQETEKILNISLPEDLRSLLSVSDGLGADIGDVSTDRYVSFYIWSTRDIVEITQEYAINKYVPGLISIGSNAGTCCFCLDYRDSSKLPVLCSVHWDDIAPEAVRFLANSLTEFMVAVHELGITNVQIESDEDIGLRIQQTTLLRSLITRLAILNEER